MKNVRVQMDYTTAAVPVPVDPPGFEPRKARLWTPRSNHSANLSRKGEGGGGATCYVTKRRGREGVCDNVTNTCNLKYGETLPN